MVGLKKKVAPLSITLILSLAFLWSLTGYLRPEVVIFPRNAEPYIWKVISWHDDKSTVEVKDSKVLLSANMKVTSLTGSLPTGVALLFENDAGRLADFSRFNRIKLLIRCSENDTFYLGISTVDPKVTKVNQGLTYRKAGTFVNCSNSWSDVDIKFDSLEVPVWWLKMFGFKASDQSIDLSKISNVFLETTFESPTNVEIQLDVASVTLIGNGMYPMVLYVAWILVVFLAVGIWFVKVRLHEKGLEKQVIKVLEYEQLSLNPIRERDRHAILEYISKNYANYELDIDLLCKVVGVSRTKVNDVLKTEFGTTFTSYVNNLRLIESARLLLEKSDANITEVAYLVGFKNISYFNKLFKEKFGVTPKAYKSQCDE